MTHLRTCWQVWATFVALAIISASAIAQTELPPDERQQLLARAAQSNTQLKTLFRKADYRGALAAGEESLRINRLVLGENHAETAWSYNNLGAVQERLGDYKACRELHEKALAIRLKVLGEEDAATAASYNNLGNLLNAQTQYVEAQKYHLRALAIKRKVLGEEHLDTILSYQNLAGAQSNSGDFATARQTYEQALAMYRKVGGEEHTELARTYYSLGVIYYRMADYAAAQTHLEQALRIQRKLLGEAHPDTASTYSRLGSVHKEQGNLAVARDYCERSLAIVRKVLGEEHTATADSLNDLGNAHWALGDFATARKLHERALEIYRNRLGEVNSSTSIAHNNLGVLLLDMDELAGSLAHHEQALRIKRQLYGDEHADVANALNGLGNLYNRMRRTTESRAAHEEALRIRLKALGENHPDTANSYLNLSNTYEQVKDAAICRKYLEQALAIEQRVLAEDHPDLATTYSNLMVLETDVGDWAAAGKWMDAQRRVTRRHVSQTLPYLSESEQLRFLRNADEDSFSKALSLGYLRSLDPNMVGRSAGWVLNGKGVAQEALASRALLARDLQNSEQAPLVQQLNKLRQQLAETSLAAATDPEAAKRRRQQLEAGSAEEARLVRELLRAGARVQAKEPWIELVAVREALPPDSVLVDIARFRAWPLGDPDRRKPRELRNRYAAWIVPREGELQLIDLGDAEPIEQQVHQVRKLLEAAADSDGLLANAGEEVALAELEKPLQELAELIWQPIAEAIGKTQQIYLSPDGALWLIPWQALPVAKNKFLVEEYTLTLLISGRDLVRSDARPSAGPPVIFANPDFDLSPVDVKAAAQAVLRGAYQEERREIQGKSRLPRVAKLPGTALEAAAVQPNLEKVAAQPALLYSERYALENVAKNLKQPRISVFATHGFFLDERTAQSQQNPLLRCGLLLAGCNPRNEGKAGGGDDGVLTGLEIVGIDFRGTEMVVLSACETGLGQVNPGEGVAGLRQAFQLAGAAAVVATLWQIPDRDSALLMNDFFANLAQGQPKAEALRQAQVRRIAARREKHNAAHPFYWAAFTLTGR